jgi:hypothetical protein
MESEGSLPCSQQPTCGIHPEPDESSPHPISFFKIDLNNYYPLTSVLVFQVVSFIQD